MSERTVLLPLAEPTPNRAWVPDPVFPPVLEIAPFVRTLPLIVTPPVQIRPTEYRTPPWLIAALVCAISVSSGLLAALLLR